MAKGKIYEAALLEQMVQGLSESVATEEQMAETKGFSTTRRLGTITRRQHSTITLVYRTSSRRSSRMTALSERLQSRHLRDCLKEQ